jgi:hypothetical protein
MARKKSTRRINLPEETLDRARRVAAGEEVVFEKPAPVKSKPKSAAPDASAAVKKTTMEDLAKEYAYVVNDLRNMGLLAATLFLLLILLSLVL